MTTALHAEAERPPRVSTQNFVPTPSPIRPPVRRIWASLPLASSPQVWTPLTALRFRSVRYCIIRLLPDAPSRVLRSCERPCLVDGGFPPSGPQEDLTATCLTSLFCVHAEHTKALRVAPPALRAAGGLDRAIREPSWAITDGLCVHSCPSHAGAKACIRQLGELFNITLCCNICPGSK